MDIFEFSKLGGITLRAYQQTVARAVVDSVLQGRGLSFAVMFPRQSGKNELQAQIEAYLLYCLCETDAELVKISPTWRPQAQNAMRRLERILTRHPLFAEIGWKKESGYLFRAGRARIYFFSGAPEANIVGATASTLLEVDEAQDVRIDKYDRDIAPMAASTHATRVFWGTAWTSRTLLARELRAARSSLPSPFPKREGVTVGEANRGVRSSSSPSLSSDALPDDGEGAQFGAGDHCSSNRGSAPNCGVRCSFLLSAPDVAREVPQYGAFVAEQVAKLGRTHPMIKTQYFSEEIDAETGMFPPDRIARMFSSSPAPSAQPIYALLIDVAGEDENAVGISAYGADTNSIIPSTRRDATALTLVQVDLTTLSDPLLRAPTYRPILRKQWVGVKHADLYGEIRALAAAYNARKLVIDATGVGAGLASFLDRALPGRVIPFTFTQSSKSRLGWGFLKIVDEGRWIENGDAARERALAGSITNIFFTQLAFTQAEVLSGPGKIMRWGVPDGTRDPATGQYVHDDLVISAALSARLDEEAWAPRSGTAAAIVRARDPLEEIDRTRF